MYWQLEVGPFLIIDKVCWQGFDNFRQVGLAELRDRDLGFRVLGFKAEVLQDFSLREYC